MVIERSVKELPRRSKTILLVDDDHRLRKVTRDILSMAGHQVLEASDLREALEHLEQVGRPVDLVITDLRYPGKEDELGGRELIKYLAGHPQHTTMPVIVMSARDRRHLDATAKVHANAHPVQKPFDPENFVELVNRLLAGKP